MKIKIMVIALGLFVPGIFAAPLNTLTELTNEKDVIRKYSKSKSRPRVYLSSGEKSIPGLRLVVSGANRPAWVVFVHGSPGGWGDFAPFLTNETLTSRANLVSVDRPGNGGSFPREPERSLQVQADRILRAFRDLSGAKKVLWVGHSYGGSVIARLAMDHPESVKGLVFVGAALDPELEKVAWYQKLAAVPSLQFLIPRWVVVVNEEMLPLRNELEKMLPFWKSVTVPVTVIHGTRDSFVPFGNADFVKEKCVKAPLSEVILTNVNHFIPWTHPERITQAVLTMLSSND